MTLILNHLFPHCHSYGTPQAMTLTTRDRDEQLSSLQLLAQEGVAADVDRYVQVGACVLM